MATRTTSYPATPVFVADPASVQQSTGRQIDWDNVPAGYANDAGDKVLPAGKFMTEISDKLVPMDSAAIVAETASHILATAAAENSKTDALTGYGTYVGGVFYENLLPDVDDGDFATFQTDFAAAGPGARWETYANDAS